MNLPETAGTNRGSTAGLVLDVLQRPRRLLEAFQSHAARRGWAAVDPACRRGACRRFRSGRREAPGPVRRVLAPTGLVCFRRRIESGGRRARSGASHATRRAGLAPGGSLSIPGPGGRGRGSPSGPWSCASGRLVGLAGVGGGARAPSSPSARRPLRGNLEGPYPRRPAGPGTRHPRRGSADDDGVADGTLSTGIRRVGDQRAADHHGRRATPVEVDRLDHAERPRDGGGLGDG